MKILIEQWSTYQRASERMNERAQTWQRLRGIGIAVNVISLVTALHV